MSYLLTEQPRTDPKIVKEYLQRNKDNIKLEYFPVGSPEFNAVEEY
ncbi:MAG TPA: hypothetical protein VN704_02765 [Verrucomicrobiae bacterium]|nr:hypothetical protein [Verrucomicrobiae bacterium]